MLWRTTACGLLLVSLGLAQTDSQPGLTLQRDLAAGESYHYAISLAAGEYLHLSVAQSGDGVSVTLLDPGGKVLLKADVVIPVPLSVVSEVSGEHQIEVRANPRAGPAIHFQVAILERRPATPQDRSLASADRIFVEAERLRMAGTSASFGNAIEKYQEILELFRAAGDRGGEAKVLSGLGRVYEYLTDKRKSVDFYQRAIPLYAAIGDRVSQAYILSFLGIVYDILGEPQKALDSLRQALPLAHGDPRLEASTLNNFGVVHNNHGEREKALDFYQQAIPMHRAAGNIRGEATTLRHLGNLYNAVGNKQKSLDCLNESLRVFSVLDNLFDQANILNDLGALYYSMDEYQKALDLYLKAMPILRRIGDRLNEGAELHNIASIYDRTGEYQKALDFYGQALSLLRATGFRAGEANTLNNIGTVYQKLGEWQRALEIFQQALPLHRATGNRASEASTLTNMGRGFFSLGDTAKARDSYHQALLLRRAVGDRTGEANALSGVARVAISDGKPREALETYSQAIALARAAGSRLEEARTLGGMGEAHAALAEMDEALECSRQALAISRAIGDPQGEAAALYQVARIARDRGDWATASSQIDAALGVVESLRHRIAGPDLRSAYLASVGAYYELAIDISMQLHKQDPTGGHAGTALEIAERARARSLLDLLAESGADIRQGADPALVERERSLQRLLNAKAQRGSAAEIDKLIAAYRDVQSQIRATSPRYAALTQPQPLRLREIQQQVLDRDTLLLEYALGKKHSYLWVVSADSITGHELPAREAVTSFARRFYEAARAENGNPSQLAGELSRMLLAPVAARLQVKRLVIVADGALQYVPFAELPLAGQPLIARHEIVMLPSASSLAVLRRETAGRTPAPRAVAVLADPVFRPDDPRVARAVAAAASSSDVQRDEALARLIGSRREAAGIAALAPPGEASQSLDFDASLATATSERIRQYRIVHFATHGLIDSAHPELSSVVLSLVDAHGAAQDGFLRLNEIYNLRLPAELVVLSACQTALGKEIRGEGLVGLTRGFMYAGAPRVVASLWKVDDKATTELMTRFYRGMLGPQRLRPAAALRAAQVAMSKEDQWRAPYYWAAWALQGDWR